MSNVATVPTTVSTLADLAKVQAELRAQKSALKIAQKLKAWETETKERNAQYVVGSVRRATAEEATGIGHIHGWVCSIECENCGEVRVVNKQDAKATRFCKECRKEARKAFSKAKRLEKKLEGRSVSDVETEIAELQSQLTALQG